MNDEIPTPPNYRAIAEAIAYQNTIDREEAGPKAPHGAIDYRGVQIDSRWNILAEYQAMRAIVDQLPDLIRVRLESIWCDSKCTNNYVITVKANHFVPDLPQAIEDAAVAVRGEHNGIIIQGDASREDIVLDRGWDQ